MNPSRLTLSLLLFSLSTLCSGNKIDSLNNISGINSFLSNTYKESRFTVIPFDSNTIYNPKKLIAFNSLKVNKFWFKTDIDKNGFTDLIVGVHDTLTGSGQQILLITSNKKGEYNKQIIISHYHFSYFPIQPPANSKYDLIICSIDGGYLNNQVVVKLDTIKYQSPYFINYSASTSPMNITKIELETTICYGTCPAFKLTITPKELQLNAIKFNEEQGLLKSDSNKLEFDRISKLLSLSKFTTFKDEYTQNVSDSPTYYLRIWYGKDSYKEIKDYPGEGNMTLMAIYDIMFNLKHNTKWE